MPRRGWRHDRGRAGEGGDRADPSPHPGEGPAPQQVAQVQGRVSRDGSVDRDPVGRERARRHTADWSL